MIDSKDSASHLLLPACGEKVGMRGPHRRPRNCGARNCGEAPSPSFASLTRPLPARGERRFSLYGPGLDRVFDVRDGGEFHVVELAVLLLDLADIDVLDDVARFRIDRDRTARA